MLVDAKIAEELFFEDEALHGFKCVDKGQWVNDHKYQYRTKIFEKDNKFYMLANSRSGSEFTDWYYESDDWKNQIDMQEVRKIEKVITDWEVIKAN